MKLNKSDLIQIENLMKLTRQGTFSLTGTEALALSECIRWLAGLYQLIAKQMEEDSKPIIPEEVKSPVTEPKKKTKKA